MPTPTQSSSPIRNISDTAHWVAHYRAEETDRPDALFRDPLARRLAGARGEQIAASIPPSTSPTWPFIARTVLIDRIIDDEVRAGADTIINLAAGLDTRPYRMNLPATLRWHEVDLPDILAFKSQTLASEKPNCILERIPLDLAEVSARRELFDRIGRTAKRALVITEGLLIYLTTDQVASLARDLAAVPSFHRWALDLSSPALLNMLNKKLGKPLAQAGSPLKFAPPEGLNFFVPLGWNPVAAHSLFHSGAKLKRVPFPMRLFAIFPDSKGTKPNRPWGGICLFERRA